MSRFRGSILLVALAALTAVGLAVCEGSQDKPPLLASPRQAQLVRGGIYTFAGCPVYGANDWFTMNLAGGGSSYAASSIDQNSAAIIANFAAAFPGTSFSVNGTDISVSQHPVVNIATSSTQKYPVQGLLHGFADDPYGDEPLARFPWNPGFIQPSNCATDDCHNVVLNASTCVDYESYDYGQVSWTGSGYRASAVFVHNLKHPFNDQYKQNGGLVTKAGLPYLGTADFGEDAALPAIPHILLMGIPGSDASSKAAGGYVAPASGGPPCVSMCANKLPFGARLRLNPNKYTCPSASTYPQANKICIQLETYGLIVTDHNGEASVFSTQLGANSDGTNPWNQNDVAQLNGIPITDFDVMTLGTVH